MKKLFPALALCICATTQAAPSIHVGSVYDYLEAGQSTYLKRITNTGDGTAFVRINLHELTFDAEGKTTESPMVNTTEDTASRTGLLASPARLIVPPGGMQATRLLYRGERDRERYYRIRFIPVMPEKEDQFEVSDSEREAYQGQMSASLNVLTGYGTIFFVRPAQTVFNTQVQDTPQTYTVNNAGNSTVELDDFRDCDAKDRDVCLPVRKHHIRPGNNFSFTKEPGRVYTFDMKEGENSKKIETKT